MPEVRIPPLLRRLILIHRALDSAGFEHAVGGALALGQYALDARATYDIDLNVIANPLNPEPLLDCLPSEIEIPSTAITQLQRDGQVRLNWPDPDTSVDLFLPQHPTLHHLVNQRAKSFDYFGDEIKVLSPTDLVIFKALFNRGKDWVDIASLHDADVVDFGEAIMWVSEIVGADDARVTRLGEIADSPRYAPGEEMTTFKWPNRPEN